MSGTAQRLIGTLQRALVVAGMPARRFDLVSQSGSAPAFRVELATGLVVKARVFTTHRAARRVATLLRVASRAGLPRPYAHVGRVLVTEYVRGETVAAIRRRRGETGLRPIVHATGRILAALHASPVSSAAGRDRIECRRVLRRVVRTLVRRRRMSTAVAAGLLSLPIPARSRFAVTHGDASPENLVLAARRLRLIDEERVAVRPVAFDLARTITRWPLGPALEQELLRAYRTDRHGRRDFLQHRRFWLATALATSIDYRLRERLAGVGPLVARLARLGRERSADLPATPR